METETNDTLRWVDEVTPTISGDPGDPDVTFPGYDLTPAMRVVLEAIHNDPDACSCYANGCGSGRPGGRPAPVGWVLHEPDQPGDPGGLSWSWTTLVETRAGRVLAVCEDCTPSNVYWMP